MPDTFWIYWSVVWKILLFLVHIYKQFLNCKKHSELHILLQHFFQSHFLGVTFQKFCCIIFLWALLKNVDFSKKVATSVNSDSKSKEYLYEKKGAFSFNYSVYIGSLFHSHFSLYIVRVKKRKVCTNSVYKYWKIIILVVKEFQCLCVRVVSGESMNRRNDFHIFAVRGNEFLFFASTILCHRWNA